jgi:hypothetical protein
MKAFAVSEFDPMASTEIEKVFDSKEKAFNHIKSKVDINSSLTKWDEDPGGDLLLLAEIKFKVDGKRALFHQWQVQEWDVE